MSADGTRIALADRKNRRTVTTVISASTGQKVRRTTWAGSAYVRDFDGDRIVVAGPKRGYLWNLHTGRSRGIVRGALYVADLGADRMAVAGKAPSKGRCETVSTITRPRTTHFRTCRDRVITFSDSGARMITGSRSADFTTVRLRTIGGKKLASYTISRSNWNIERPSFETDTTVLFTGYSGYLGAVYRCTVTACERASKWLANPYF